MLSSRNFPDESRTTRKTVHTAAKENCATLCQTRFSLMILKKKKKRKYTYRSLLSTQTYIITHVSSFPVAKLSRNSVCELFKIVLNLKQRFYDHGHEKKGFSHRSIDTRDVRVIEVSSLRSHSKN